MTYYYSAEGLIITRERAFQELRAHGCMDDDYQDFLDQVGDLDVYRAQDVLVFLGY